MLRTESPEEVTGSAGSVSRSERVSDSAVAVGKWGAKLAAYAVATVAITFFLLRPKRAGPNTRGSLFLGSGVIVVLIKTLLSVSDGASATAPPASATPVLAAAKPAPAPAPPATQTQAAPRLHPANVATVTAPRSGQAEPRAARPTPATALTSSSAAVPANKPAPSGVTRVASSLGQRYTDKTNRYSVQFPAGWGYKLFKDGGCFLIDASDGQGGSISVGFSKFPATMSVDEIVPAKVTRALQQRAGTVVQGSGYATLNGRRCLWHKYTGPIAHPDGSSRMTVVHYLLPLQDGRALELRVAATPEKFNELAPRMKQSVDSLKLLPAAADTGSGSARAR